MLSKYLLLVISILQIFISQVRAANGTCEKISSTECSFLPTINAKISQEEFDNIVRKKYGDLKEVLTGGNNSCDTDFSSKVRFLKTLACAFVVKDQGCGGSTTVCPDVCTKFTESLKGVGCIDIEGKSSVNGQCSIKTAPINNCLSYYDVETKTCGFEDVEAKTAFCAQNPDESCCTGKAAEDSSNSSTNTSTAKKEAVKSHINTSENEKKEGGGFFKSKVFIVILILIILIIAVLGYFYYVGSKDEKEERMRNLELGNRGYMESLYHGNNDSGIERKLSSGYNYGSEDYNLSGSNYNYHKKTEDENPFDDSNRIEYNRKLSIKHYGDDDDDNDYLNKSYNNSYSKPTKYIPFETSYNDVQNTLNSESLAAPPDVHNPFESPKFEEDSIEMQLNNFPMPYNNYGKSKNEEANANSSVPATTTTTTTTTTTIPTDKDINIGDDVVKPSVVTLTEIKTPEENNISDEKEVETPKEPTKGIVNMIDIKKPSSNEAVNTNNGLTPSILITNVNGDVSSIEPEESITEEFSEMPEPKPFRAIHAYEPQIDDELRLEVDNEIDVLYEYDDGWCWAINKTTNEQGACPLLCLVSAKEASNGEHGWEKDMEIVKVPGRRESMLSFDSSNISFSLPRNMSLPRNKQ